MASERALLATMVLVLVGALVGGILVDRIARSRTPPDARAADLANAGKLGGAEQIYWSLLQKGPVTVPLLVSFLDAHERAVFDASPVITIEPRPSGERTARVHGAPAVDEATIDAFLANHDLPPAVALLGTYWRGVVRDAVDPDVERDVIRAADAEPPVPWANHLLAENAARNVRLDDAAERFLREGVAFRERASDVDAALSIWAEAGEWDRLDQALRDPRVTAAAQPWLQLRAAIRAHDWKRAAIAFVRSLPPSFSLGTALLAAIAALAWGTFCARLGGLGARPRFRTPLYLAAFALGFASVSLTLALAALEEGLLRMTESGDPLRDALYFTFGVGLREEVPKLLFFAPLLPLLRRKGTRLDVLVCGAIVGLGFAAEENLSYLRHGDLTTGMARFLTANFFHMAMTAILAGALDDMIRAKDEGASMRFSIALLTVAAMHGAYDFLLSSSTGTFFALIIFFLLTRQFLSLVSVARAKERAANPRLLETFGVAMATVVGASFVYASARVGPAAAASALTAGLIDLGLVIIMFVQALREV